MSSASSLRTDSDCEDLKPSALRNIRVKRPIEVSNTKNFVSDMLEQIWKEAHAEVDQSFSCDLSSNNDKSQDSIFENDSFLHTEKITEINKKLGKNCLKALMAFKASSRPIISPWEKRRDEVLITKNLTSTLDPGTNLSVSGRASSRKRRVKKQLVKKNRLVKSLRDIHKLKKIKEKNFSCLEGQLSEIRGVDRERVELRERIDRLSQSLDGVVKERRSGINSQCGCVIC